MKAYAVLGALILLSANVANANTWDWRRHEIRKERHEEKVREERHEKWQEARHERQEVRHDAWAQHQAHVNRPSWGQRQPTVVTTTPTVITTTPVVATAPVVRPATTRPYYPHRF